MSFRSVQLKAPIKGSVGGLFLESINGVKLVTTARRWDDKTTRPPGIETVGGNDSAELVSYEIRTR